MNSVLKKIPSRLITTVQREIAVARLRDLYKEKFSQSGRFDATIELTDGQINHIRLYFPETTPDAELIALIASYVDDTLPEILEMLRSATERSHELNVRIHSALVNPQVMTNGGDHKGNGVKYEPLSYIVNRGTWEDWEGLAIGYPDYTGSMDALLKHLVFTNGWTWCVIDEGPKNNDDPRHVHWAECRKLGVGTHIDWPSPAKDSEAWTPALALAIAAVRSRII